MGDQIYIKKNPNYSQSLAKKFPQRNEKVCDETMIWYQIENKAKNRSYCQVLNLALLCWKFPEDIVVVVCIKLYIYIQLQLIINLLQ